MHHRRMLWLLAAVACLVVGLGALYGVVDGCGIPDGMYFAVVTVSTVGYGDIIPRGWPDHLVALMIMVLIIPLWSSVFSLLTSGFISSHADRRHEEALRHLDKRHEEALRHLDRKHYEMRKHFER